MMVSSTGYISSPAIDPARAPGRGIVVITLVTAIEMAVEARRGADDADVVDDRGEAGLALMHFPRAPTFPATPIFLENLATALALSTCNGVSKLNEVFGN